MHLCAFISLSSERAATSPSESAVIVTSVVECLRYCIVYHREEEEDQKKIRTMLISQQVGSHRHTYLSIHVKSTKVLACLTLFVFQLLPLLEKALGNSSLQNGPLFLLVTEMLVSWENKADLHIGEASEGKDVFQVLLADFWERLGLLFVRYADNEEADPRALEGVATLLQVSLVLI